MDCLSSTASVSKPMRPKSSIREIRAVLRDSHFAALAVEELESSAERAGRRWWRSWTSV